MKKLGLFLSLLICSTLIAGCHNNCNCDCEQTTNENETTKKAVEYCIEHEGTHTLIENAIGPYGKCTFPNGVVCEDNLIGTDLCNLEPNLEDIDTEEERMDGCEQSVSIRMDENMKGAVFFGLEWDNDSEEIVNEEGNVTFIRKNFYAKYDRNGQHWKLPGTCEANFVDGSLGTTYGQEFLVEDDYNQFLEDIKSSGEQPQRINDYPEEVSE